MFYTILLAVSIYLDIWSSNISCIQMPSLSEQLAYLLYQTWSFVGRSLTYAIQTSGKSNFYSSQLMFKRIHDL